MADQKEIVLRQGDASPKDIVLRELPVADVATTTIYLFENASPAADVILRNPLEVPVTGGAQSVTAAGIATAEAFGSSAVSAAVAATGIASAEAAGSPAVGTTVAAAGVTSAEAIGSPSVAAQIAAAGIVSEEAFGQPTVDAVAGAHAITGAGQIASDESFGSITAAVGITGSAIASAEAHGEPAVQAGISTAGIASEEQVGEPIVATGHIIAAAGIASDEAFGQPTIEVPGRHWRPPPTLEYSKRFNPTYLHPHNIDGAGNIASEEYFGRARVLPVVEQVELVVEDEVRYELHNRVIYPHSIAAKGIEDQPQVGTPTIALVPLPALEIHCTSIAANEACGEPAIALGVIAASHLVNLAQYRIAHIVARSADPQSAVGRPAITLGELPLQDEVSEEEFVFILDLLLAA